MRTGNALVRAAFSGLLVAGLAACETPERPVFPELTFDHLAPIRLDVAEVEIASDYVPPLASPNVEHLFPVPPGMAAERWARDRLVAAGTGGFATFTVKVASVVETPLKKSGGVAGLITTDQAARYDGKIEVEIRVRDESGMRTAFTTARVERTRTVPEGLSLNELEQVWFEMTEAMLKDLNTQLEQNIDRYLAGFLK